METKAQLLQKCLFKVTGNQISEDSAKLILILLDTPQVPKVSDAKRVIHVDDFYEWMVSAYKEDIEGFLETTWEKQERYDDEIATLEPDGYVAYISELYHSGFLQEYVNFITPEILDLEQEDFFGTEGLNKRLS